MTMAGRVTVETASRNRNKGEEGTLEKFVMENEEIGKARAHKSTEK